MLKVFKLKITESGLGRYNASKITTLYVVAESSSDAIRRVFTEDTLCIEVVDAQPCLIVSNK